MLSLMSFCDRQAIPEALVRRRSNIDVEDDVKSSGSGEDEYLDSNSDAASNGDSDGGDSAGIVNDSFDRDISMLEGFSFVFITINTLVFEMHRLVQVAT